MANIVSIANKKKSPKFIDIIKKGFIPFSNVLSKSPDVRLILKSNKKKIIPRIFFDYVPKSSTFDTIFVRKNIPFLSLQRHSEIIQISFFVQIQCGSKIFGVDDRKAS